MAERFSQKTEQLFAQDWRWQARAPAKRIQQSRPRLEITPGGCTPLWGWGIDAANIAVEHEQPTVWGTLTKCDQGDIGLLAKVPCQFWTQQVKSAWSESNLTFVHDAI